MGTGHAYDVQHKNLLVVLTNNDRRESIKCFRYLLVVEKLCWRPNIVEGSRSQVGVSFLYRLHKICGVCLSLLGSEAVGRSF